mmetsp:Transcript_5105/g.13786  ORF Transcript_5105/g.13786 Transcript_5105/m.13786 type:complete len:566 (+) Transcript_5105:30-1727(+)
MSLLSFMGVNIENYLSDKVAGCLVNSYLLLKSGYQLLLSTHESFSTETGILPRHRDGILHGLLLLMRSHALSGGSTLVTSSSLWGLVLGAARQLLPQGRDETVLHAWLLSNKGQLIPAEAFVAASVQVLIMALKKGATPVVVDCAVQLANTQALPDQTHDTQTLAVSMQHLSALLVNFSLPSNPAEINSTSGGLSPGSTGKVEDNRGTGEVEDNSGSSGSSRAWSVHAFMQTVRLNAFQMARGAYASCADADQEAHFFASCRQIADLMSAAEEEHDEQQQQQQRGQPEDESITLAPLQLSQQQGQGGPAHSENLHIVHSSRSCQSHSDGQQGQGAASKEQGHSAVQADCIRRRGHQSTPQTLSASQQGHSTVQADCSSEQGQSTQPGQSAVAQSHATVQAGQGFQAMLDPLAEEKQASLEAGYAGAWVLVQQGLYEDAHAWATALVHSAGKVWAPMLLAQAAWLAARCMLVLGGSRDTFDRLVQVAYAAEQHLSSRAAGSVPKSALGGSIPCLAVDRALAIVAEGRADVIDFQAMLTESEERKGFRMASVPAQPKFYGGSRLAFK